MSSVDGLLTISNESEFRAFYQAAGRAAVAKAFRTCGRLDVAEEIAQEAFLDLWRSGISSMEKKQAFGWIYKACHHKCIDHLRRHATRHEIGALEKFVGSVGGREDQRLISEETFSSLLKRLTTREAEVLIAERVDGMSQTEIAEFLNLSRKTIVRICAKLRLMIGEIRHEGNDDGS